MSIDRWMGKEGVVYIHSGILLSKEKENEVMPFAATWMSLEIIILSEVSQKEKGNIMWYHLYVESKICHKWTCLQNRNTFMDRRQTYSYQRGKVEGKDKIWSFGLVDTHYYMKTDR